MQAKDQIYCFAYVFWVNLIQNATRWDPTPGECNTDHKWPYMKIRNLEHPSEMIWRGTRSSPMQIQSSGRKRGGAIRSPAINYFCLSRWLLTSHRRAEEERLAQCLQHRSYRLRRSENFLSGETEGIRDTGPNTVLTQKCKTRKEITEMLRLRHWSQHAQPHADSAHPGPEECPKNNTSWTGKPKETPENSW